MYDGWLSLTMNAVRLGFESHEVIVLRMTRLAMPGAGWDREARRMVSEKAAAFGEAGAAAAALAVAGKSAPAIAGDVIRRYRRHVRGNARRLSR